MKQNLDPRVVFSVIAVLVVVLGVMVIWIWGRPSAAEGSGGPVASTASSANASSSGAMHGKVDHGGPSEAQKQDIQEWKKAHPEATTRY
jgi:hypothetical protein